jgi:hypothetical protein
MYGYLGFQSCTNQLFLRSSTTDQPQHQDSQRHSVTSHKSERKPNGSNHTACVCHTWELACMSWRKPRVSESHMKRRDLVGQWGSSVEVTICPTVPQHSQTLQLCFWVWSITAPATALVVSRPGKVDNRRKARCQTVAGKSARLCLARRLHPCFSTLGSEGVES